MSDCSVHACERRATRRSYCALHYQRWRRHGDPLYGEKATFAFCTEDDCGRPTRSSGSPYCEMHYYRLRRTGSTVRTRNWNRLGGVCSVDDCGSPEIRPGLCMKHAARMDRHGTTDFIPHHQRRMVRGERHHMWRGAEAGYGGSHIRVRVVKGSPRNHICPCGAPARQWAYDHKDPDERSAAGVHAYSTKPEHYVAMCVPCHKKADLEYLKSIRAAVV